MNLNETDFKYENEIPYLNGEPVKNIFNYGLQMLFDEQNKMILALLLHADYRKLKKKKSSNVITYHDPISNVYLKVVLDE